MSKKEILIKRINDLNIVLDDKAMQLALISSEYYVKGIKETEADLIKARECENIREKTRENEN